MDFETGLQATDALTAQTMPYQQQFVQSQQQRYKNYGSQQSTRTYYPQVSATPQSVPQQQFPQYYNGQYGYPTASAQLPQHSQSSVSAIGRQTMTQYFMPQNTPQHYNVNAFPHNIVNFQQQNFMPTQPQLNYYYNQQMGGNNARR